MVVERNILSQNGKEKSNLKEGFIEFSIIHPTKFVKWDILHRFRKFYYDIKREK